MGSALITCENCGTPLADHCHYCGKCGQQAIDYRRSFGRVLLDALDSFFNWDSKFFATLGLLVTRPWRLTNDFLAGKRIRYVHPTRLYLLVSVAFFFGVHQLANHARGRDKLPTAADRAIEQLPPDAQGEARGAMQRAGVNGPMSEPRGIHREFKQGSQFDKWMAARIKEKVVGENGMNTKVFLLALVGRLPAMMLCCIPLFALVLKFLYFRKSCLYIDHLIYALHIHSFAYVAILVTGFTIALAPSALSVLTGCAVAALVLATIIVVLISIRRVYRQGWGITIFKFLFGTLTYLAVLGCALAATFLATLALPS